MKQLILLFGLTFCSFHCHADIMRNYFEKSPDAFFPMLTHNNKLDLLDFKASGMDAKVKNIYGEQTELVNLTDNYLRIKTSTSSQVEMMTLVCGRDTLICLVKTLYAPEPESEIKIIAASTMKVLHPLKKYVAMPDVDDFLFIPKGKNKKDLAHVKSKMDLCMVSALMKEEDSSLHFTIKYTNSFTEDKEEITPFVKKEIVARWNGKKFVWVHQ